MTSSLNSSEASEAEKSLMGTLEQVLHLGSRRTVQDVEMVEVRYLVPFMKHLFIHLYLIWKPLADFAHWSGIIYLDIYYKWYILLLDNHVALAMVLVE